MKKLIFAAAAVAAVFSVSNANAQKIEKVCACGQVPVKMIADQRDIHKAYEAGDVNFDKVKEGMIKAGYNWRVKTKKHGETWVAGNPQGQDVYVKMKEGKKSTKVKAHVGRDRMFAKDLNSGNGKKHVAKIYEEKEKYVVKSITNENGCQVIAKALEQEQAKKDKKAKKSK